MSALFCGKWFARIESDRVFRSGLNSLTLSICFKADGPCRSSSEFRCRGSRKCIPNTWLCDGEADCADKSDEEDCTTYPCGVREFQCRESGKCILTLFVCDGDNDCQDKSDEENCTQASTCSTNYFKCRDNGAQCIPKGWICDGDRDCSDNSDEANCTQVVPTCSRREFQCEDGSCVHVSWRCDGDTDCSDNSDELNCSTASPSPPRRCNSSEFQCHSEGCVEKTKHCDGKSDCQDESDEKTCGEELDVNKNKNDIITFIYIAHISCAHGALQCLSKNTIY